MYIHIYWLHGCRGSANSCNSYKRKGMYIQRTYSVGLFQFVLDPGKEPRAGAHRATYRRPWVSLWFYRHERPKVPVCTQLTMLISICFYYVNLQSLHAVEAKVMQHCGREKKRRSYYHQIQTQCNT